MPPIRPKGKTEINHIAFFVIAILGVVAVTTSAWSGWLIHEAVTAETAVESASVALIGQMVSIATLTIGGLIAMLTSTGPKPPPPPPPFFDSEGKPSTPVTVVNPSNDPVLTEPVVEEDTEVVDEPAEEAVEAPKRRRGRSVDPE